MRGELGLWPLTADPPYIVIYDHIKKVFGKTWPLKKLKPAFKAYIEGIEEKLLQHYDRNQTAAENRPLMKYIENNTELKLNEAIMLGESLQTLAQDGIIEEGWWTGDKPQAPGEKLVKKFKETGADIKKETKTLVWFLAGAVGLGLFLRAKG